MPPESSANLSNTPKPPAWPIAASLYAVALLGSLLVRIGRLGKLGMRMERWALIRLGVWAD